MTHAVIGSNEATIARNTARSWVDLYGYDVPEEIRDFAEELIYDALISKSVEAVERAVSAAKLFMDPIKGAEEKQRNHRTDMLRRHISMLVEKLCAENKVFADHLFSVFPDILALMKLGVENPVLSQKEVDEYLEIYVRSCPLKGDERRKYAESKLNYYLFRRESLEEDE